MILYKFYCPRCDDRWEHPGPINPRSTCIDCGAELDVERVEVQP